MGDYHRPPPHTHTHKKEKKNNSTNKKEETVKSNLESNVEL